MSGFGLVDPRREPACCADCGAELTRDERREVLLTDHRCDACYLDAHAAPTQMATPAAAAQTIAERRALRDARERLPAPPRVPADMRATARPPRRTEAA